MTAPVLTALRIADPPEPWAALGFAVAEDGFSLGGVRVELSPGAGGGIVSWALDGVAGLRAIDGLPTESAPVGALANLSHDNGAIGIDHVVVITPNLDRTAQALAAAGLELRRIRQSDRGRQGFRRLGPVILELVEASSLPASEPARFWGLVVVVSDLDALAQRLGARLGRPRAAVQPGRRIATLRSAAGIGPALAFMTPEPE